MKGRKMSENIGTTITADGPTAFHLEFYGIAVDAKNWPALRELLDEWVTEHTGDPQLFPVAVRSWIEIQSGQVIADEPEYRVRRERWFER
jgi:hypothetical protein